MNYFKTTRQSDVQPPRKGHRACHLSLDDKEIGHMQTAAFLDKSRTMNTVTVLAKGGGALSELEERAWSKASRWLLMLPRLVKPMSSPLCLSYTKSSHVHLTKQEQDNFILLGTGGHLSCLHQHVINCCRESWCSFIVVAVVSMCD